LSSESGILGMRIELSRVCNGCGRRSDRLHNAGCASAVSPTVQQKARPRCPLPGAIRRVSFRRLSELRTGRKNKKMRKHGIQPAATWVHMACGACARRVAHPAKTALLLTPTRKTAWEDKHGSASLCHRYGSVRARGWIRIRARDLSVACDHDLQRVSA